MQEAHHTDFQISPSFLCQMWTIWNFEINLLCVILIMQIDAKRQNLWITQVSTGTHVKKGIFGFTTGLNRLLGFFPTELHNFICMWWRSGNFIYICGMSVSVESSLFVGGWGGGVRLHGFCKYIEGMYSVPFLDYKFY